MYIYVYIYDDFTNIYVHTCILTFGFIYLDPDVVACLFVGKKRPFDVNMHTWCCYILIIL